MESDSFPRHGDVENGFMDPGILMLALSNGIQAPVVFTSIACFLSCDI
jgi:hypothetical protein